MDYMRFLKSKGYDGWRFDFAKGYSPQFTAEYVTTVGAKFSVGEYWDGSADAVWGWVQGTGQQSTAFDFPLRYAAKTAINSNNFGCLEFAGVISKNSAFASTFLDNHDTARNDRFGDQNALAMGYALLLTHPGTPWVFIDDWNNSYVRSAITKLIPLRKQVGISSLSPLYVYEARGGLYAARITGTKGRVEMKLGSDDWQPSNVNAGQWSLVHSGYNFAVWTDISVQGLEQDLAVRAEVM